MNFLGHWWLSPMGESEILAGNFMGDFVKGKAYLNYPPQIQKGILLHRQIDSFTDSHASTRSIRSMLSPVCGRFGWLATDIFYDHFLSLHWARYSSEGLEAFVFRCIEELRNHQKHFSKENTFFFEKLQENGWSLMYADQTQLRTILLNMGRRTNFMEAAKALDTEIERFLEHTEPLALAFLQDCRQRFI
jgi:acyl carrier protein phosphodiesterase